MNTHAAALVAIQDAMTRRDVAALEDAHHPPVGGIQHLASVFRARLEKHTLTDLPPAAATPTRPGRL
jgi:hypothetical protein